MNDGELKLAYDAYLLTCLGMSIDDFIEGWLTFEEFKERNRGATDE